MPRRLRPLAGNSATGRSLARCTGEAPLRAGVVSSATLLPSTAASRCSAASDGRARPRSIFDSMLSEQPAASLATRNVLPWTMRACLSCGPNAAIGSSPVGVWVSLRAKAPRCRVTGRARR